MSSQTNDVTEGFKMTELGRLPEDWNIVPIGDVAYVTSGGSAPQGDHYFGGSNPFIRVQHIEQGTDRVTGWDLITDEAVQDCGLRLYREGTIVFPKSGASIYLEKRAVLPLDGYLVSHLCALTPNSAIVESGFLFHAIRNIRFAELKADGYPTLNLSEIKATVLPLPPLPEQRAIARVLSTIQKAIEAQDKLISAARELKKSLMKHLFTYGPVPVADAEKVPLKETEIGPVPEHWEVVKLEAVTMKTKQVDPRRKPTWVFKYVDVSGISREKLRIIDSMEYQGEEAPHRARKLVRKGDIVFATVRPYLKRMAIIPDEFDGQIVSTAFCIIRCQPDSVEPSYIFQAVTRDDFVQRVSEHQRGSSYPAVTDKDILTQPIPMPSIPEQQGIALMLMSVDNKVEAEEKRKAALETLFKAVLHQLMTGRLRVKEPEVAAA